MQKKQSKNYIAHKDCIFCIMETKRFLTLLGEPILGRCQYENNLFLLRENKKCQYAKKK